jgi:hypothetical protein
MDNAWKAELDYGKILKIALSCKQPPDANVLSMPLERFLRAQEFYAHQVRSQKTLDPVAGSHYIRAWNGKGYGA